MSQIDKFPAAVFELLDFWKAERGSRVLPHVSSLNPLNLRKWIGDLSVIEVCEGEKRFYIRLHGSITSDNIGRNFSKQYLEDCTPSHAFELAVAPYEASIAHRLPVFSVITPGVATGDFDKLQRLVLPFTESEQTNEDNSASIDRFLIWVGPTFLAPYENTTVYGDSIPTKADRKRFEDALELHIIDVDDPAYDLDNFSQSMAPSAAVYPFAKHA